LQLVRRAGGVRGADHEGWQPLTLHNVAAQGGTSILKGGFIRLERKIAESGLKTWIDLVRNFGYSVEGELGLTLNEAKTSLKDARQERFAFLGYSFGPHYPYNPSARLYLYMSASPSKKSVQQLKTKVRELLVPGNNESWLEGRDDLNRLLRGWSSYFNLGSPGATFRSVDHYVRERVRFLARRHGAGRHF
jgi:group II intron maturase